MDRREGPLSGAGWRSRGLGRCGFHGATGSKPAWSWGGGGGSEEGGIVQTKSFVVCCCQGEQGQVMVVEDGT